jgi:serine/threonine protein kinase
VVLVVGFSTDDRIGNYRVETELGPAGWGLLIQARHVVLPRRVILKVVHPAFADTQACVLQTLREACILEAIAHPGVPIVYESGTLKDGRPWFAFEPIAGPTLEELLASGPMSVREVVGLVRDLADLLDHAHRRGVIHGGLRPDRIVVTDERRASLCIPDWSFATTHDATAPRPPAAAERSARYLAPELMHAEASGSAQRIDGRADMFSLGVIAYHALTGGLPFATCHDAALYVPAHQRRPGAPSALAAIIDSLLAFDRLDRPSAAAVRADLDWMLETLSDLHPRPIASRVPRRAIVRGPAGTGTLRGDAGGGARGTGLPPEQVVLREQPRPRRLRWTPDVYTPGPGDGDLPIVGDDRPK